MHTCIHYNNYNNHNNDDDDVNNLNALKFLKAFSIYLMCLSKIHTHNSYWMAVELLYCCFCTNKLFADVTFKYNFLNIVSDYVCIYKYMYVCVCVYNNIIIFDILLLSFITKC